MLEINNVTFASFHVSLLWCVWWSKLKVLYSFWRIKPKHQVWDAQFSLLFTAVLAKVKVFFKQALLGEVHSRRWVYKSTVDNVARQKKMATKKHVENRSGERNVWNSLYYNLPQSQKDSRISRTLFLVLSPSPELQNLLTSLLFLNLYTGWD